MAEPFFWGEGGRERLGFGVLAYLPPYPRGTQDDERKISKNEKSWSAGAFFDRDAAHAHGLTE